MLMYFTNGDRGRIVRNPWGFPNAKTETLTARNMAVGLRSGLIDPKHEATMGSAVWLYLWCVDCQTNRAAGRFVLGGKPLTYAEIETRSGFPARKVRRWLDILRRGGYVFVTYLNGKALRIEISKPKKWTPKQAEIPFESAGTSPSKNGQSPCPKMVSHLSKNGQSKQSSIRELEKSTPAASETRRYQRDRRLEREAEVKREANAGKGPEVIHDPNYIPPPACAVCGRSEKFHGKTLHIKKHIDSHWIEHPFMGKGDENSGSGVGSSPASGGEKNDGDDVDAGAVGRSEAEERRRAEGSRAFAALAKAVIQ